MERVAPEEKINANERQSAVIFMVIQVSP